LLDGTDIIPIMARPKAMARNLIIQILLYRDWPCEGRASELSHVNPCSFPP
jgi:hypothetical protein